ncbi:WD repeat-containing protein 49 [Acanthosepion pharaonis]|uniref:WD repeat-containing protein 49 n=1 Tax=Acanthosepion pharaonis TaxID=158019 RepID=A0A812CF71_ACAPH|nr:WD repeat-containing protein 49 [Sepia pharaonis]
MQFNLIATAGVNHQVGLWNPYVKSKPNGILRGHMASVVQVQILTSRSLLFSFSKDKVLRIWDIQLQVCLQRLAGIFPKGGDVCITLLLDEIAEHKDENSHDSNRMFLTFGSMLTMIEMKSERKDRVISHEVAVMAAVYTSFYNQVGTISLSFWSVLQAD